MKAHEAPPAASARAGGIGVPLVRREDARLIIGAGSFGDDLSLPGQAFAIVVRATHAHARILKIDVADARSAAGVLEVLTGADYLADGLHPMPLSPEAMSPPDIKLQNSDGSPIVIPPLYPLAIDRVRFIGEGVAWIVAESVLAAKAAADLIAVEYEPLPATADAKTASEPSATRLWENTESNVALDAQVGDAAATEAAFSAADHVVSLETLVPRVTGVPMEPRTALGTYDEATGRFTLYAGGGSVTRPKADLSAMLGVPAEQVRVLARDVGGNFGTRNSSYPEFALVAWSARRLGRPVKWTCERSESFLTDYQGRDLAVTAELALDRDGNFLALRSSNLSNLGAYPVSFIPLTKGTELMSSLYRIPLASARARGVYTNTAPTTPYRSAGRPEAMFVIERLIDIAARKHGFDRVELRRTNFVPEGAFPYGNPYGMTYDSGSYKGVFDRVLQLADYDGFPVRKMESEARGFKRGIGFGCYIESASGAPYERASVTVRPDERVTVVIGTLSSGQGHETSFAQLLSEWLGVSPDALDLVTGDTDVVAVGGGSHSGRSMRHAGTTISIASKQIIEKGRLIAAHVLEASAGDIVFSEGRFSITGTDRAMGLFDVARAAAQGNGLPRALRGDLSATGDVESRVASFPYGCHVSEVEIDLETCHVHLDRYTALDDVGRAVNPLILHGQAHGGIAQGFGEAIKELCAYDAGAQLLSGSFMDYAMPRARDLPRYDTAISEVPSTTHPLGFRGGGEGGISPALGVIVNAIVDAVAEYGVTHIEMPVTPERLWNALRGRHAGAGSRRRMHSSQAVLSFHN